jgi:hypothetical protein
MKCGYNYRGNDYTGTNICDSERPCLQHGMWDLPKTSVLKGERRRIIAEIKADFKARALAAIPDTRNPGQKGRACSRVAGFNAALKAVRDALEAL